MNSKFPLPSEVTDLRFLRGKSLPGYAAFDTAANPVRLFLSRDQIEQLVHYARITLEKIASDERIGQRTPDV